VSTILGNVAFVILIILLSNTLHEMAHLLFCLFFRCEVVEFKIPFLIFYRNRQLKAKFSIKEHNRCSFISNSPSKALWITIIGPLTNLIIGVAALVLILHCKTNWGILVGGVYNIVMCIYNLLPSTDGDGLLIYRLLKEK